MSDLTELFDRDPEHLSDLDIEAIIRKQREHQAQYELGGKPYPKGDPPKAPKAPKTDKSLDLLKKLGLG